MQFLTIKKRNRARKDGREYSQAVVIKKARKFGKVINEQCISTKKPVLITGAHASGKSYWLDRLHADAARVWPRINAQPLHLASVRPLSAWTDVKHLELWWAGRENVDDDRHWGRLKAWERVDFMPHYLRETGAVLFVDDAHNLSGRKLKLVQDCVRAAKVWVMTTSDEGRIAPSLRKDVMGSDPQTFRLDSDVAYDSTSILMWIAMIVCMGFGAYEVAIVLGGLKMFASGSRATKQN